MVTNILLPITIKFHHVINMTLSQNTLDHLLDAECSIRAAIKSAAANESPLIVTQLSKLLYDLDHLKQFEDLQDIITSHLKDKENKEE